MAAPDSEYPLEFDLDRSRGLRIRWADGLESEIPLAVLRRACPCATCRAEREAAEHNPLRVVPRMASPDDQVVVREAELAGSYALRIRWADGHDTGIYEFRMLRMLAEQVSADGGAGGSGAG
jgi:DUF971 family protein